MITQQTAARVRGFYAIKFAIGGIGIPGVIVSLIVGAFTSTAGTYVFEANYIPMLAVGVYLQRRVLYQGEDPNEVVLRFLHGLHNVLSGVLTRSRESPPPALADVAGGSGSRRFMQLAALLMPPAAGRTWLAGADSFLAEAPPSLQRAAIGSYIVGAPQVIVVTWVAALTRRGVRSR